MDGRALVRPTIRTPGLTAQPIKDRVLPRNGGNHTSRMEVGQPTHNTTQRPLEQSHQRRGPGAVVPTHLRAHTGIPTPARPPMARCMRGMTVTCTRAAAPDGSPTTTEVGTAQTLNSADRTWIKAVPQAAGLRRIWTPRGRAGKAALRRVTISTEGAAAGEVAAVGAAEGVAGEEAAGEGRSQLSLGFHRDPQKGLRFFTLLQDTTHVLVLVATGYEASKVE